VLSLIRSMRGGKDYDAEWGKRMRGTGPYAWQIARRFDLTTKRLGLNEKDAETAHRPVRASETGEGEQLSLL
jgi:DNA repair photolyase